MFLILLCSFVVCLNQVFVDLKPSDIYMVFGIRSPLGYHLEICTYWKPIVGASQRMEIMDSNQVETEESKFNGNKESDDV